MTRKRSFVALGLAFAVFAGTPVVLAQNLEMAPAPAATAPAGTPNRGMSMGQVERQYGAPSERFAPVGQPPITRWVYADKVVYFEYDHVVHAVVVHNK
jgi:hypothetical protein